MNQPINHRVLSVDTLKSDLFALIHFAKTFFRQPLQSIQLEPEWDYQRSTVFLLLTSFLSAFFSGVIQKSIGQFLVSFVFLPFLSVGIALLITLALAYTVKFVHQRKLETVRVFQIVAIAVFPFLVFRVFRTLAPPVTLIGLAATCALLIVGLTDRFQLPRKSVIKIISIFFAFYMVYWSFDLVRRSNFRQMASQNISDESIKLLDQEFKPAE